MEKYFLIGEIYHNYYPVKFRGEIELKDKDKFICTLLKDFHYVAVGGTYSEKPHPILNFPKFPIIVGNKCVKRVELAKRNWLEEKVEFEGTFLGTAFMDNTKVRRDGLNVIVPEQYAVSAEVQKM